LGIFVDWKGLGWVPESPRVERSEEKVYVGATCYHLTVDSERMLFTPPS
jgi:hypothetical protein